MIDRKIPRTMSTQHPDNARAPKWCQGEIIQGEDEVYEAYFAYSELGCQEVMWDSEGKDVDTRVVRKLLTNHRDFFKNKAIGQDVFLTYRIPNPKIESAERKILLETLANLPVSHDVASSFYGKSITPIFEVILPFTTSNRELIWLFNYYREIIGKLGNISLDKTVKCEEWLGDFKPKSIKVIPLIEDMKSLLSIDRILQPFLDCVKPKYLRVFIARSDPALNYGLVSAILLAKIALSKLKSIESKTKVEVYPIIGVGTMPFRGHLSPDNLQGFLKEYSGIYTVTVQSALKYDYSMEKTKRVVETLNKSLPYGEALTIGKAEEKTLIKVVSKFTAKYQSVMEDFAPLINSVASLVPQRRARKLHIGLFGYSRRVRGVLLPRAIPFASALYTLGVPPEIIGFSVLADLNENEIKLLEGFYLNMKNDLEKAGECFSWQNINLLLEMYEKIAEKAGIKAGKLEKALTEILSDVNYIEENLGVKLNTSSLTQRKYENTVNNFLISYLEGEDVEAQKYLIESAAIRKCLG